MPLLNPHFFFFNNIIHNKAKDIILILQVDQAIQPGLTLLNWTYLNIDKYLARINKALGKQKKKEINAWSVNVNFNPVSTLLYPFMFSVQSTSNC